MLHVIGLKQTRDIKDVTWRQKIRRCRGLLGREATLCTLNKILT